MSLRTDVLRQFTGTQAYHRLSIMSKRVVFTDGCQYVASNGGCWLMDLLAKCITVDISSEEMFVAATLQVDDERKGTLTFTNGDYKVLHTEEIPFTDFPLPKIEFFAALSGDGEGNEFWVWMLPSEY